MSTSENAHRLHLQELETEATAWLATRPAPTNTSALYDAVLAMPYLRDLTDHHSNYVFKSEQTLATTFCLGREEGLPIPLPESPAECACADLRGVTVERIYLSGSVRECTDVRLFSAEISDIDVMFQLGPVTVRAAGERPRGRGGNAAAVDGQEAAGAAPGVSVIQGRTAQPGFVLLRHERLHTCRHPGRLPLAAHRVVGLMDHFRRTMTSQPPCYSGPSVATTIQDVFRDPKAIDLVACVRCPSWPHEEYASRPRPSGAPNQQLVARLCRTPAFLVPVGFTGSPTEELEWRLSFSRHEYIAYRSMTDMQRVCLPLLKHCKAVVGEAARPIKSYYMKTALMWLVESRPAHQWSLETMHECLRLILRYLEVCLSHDHLPCYFWPEINLLASRSAAEKAELTRAVAALRQRLLPAMLALLADWLGQPVPDLAQQLLSDARCISEADFYKLTAANAVQELATGDWRPLNVVKDLALNGKIRPYGKLPKIPLCSALSLGIEAGREFNWRMKQNEGGNRSASNIIGVVQPLLRLAQQVREAAEPEDSWMRED